MKFNDIYITYMVYTSLLTSSEGNKTRKKQGKCRTGFKSEVHTALKVPDGFQKGGA